ncbi:uncharacterized protein FOMMEDRAFT_154345 [Fomitiporia mediterranea MF3/22]|uniref:uncharacterized protein n=1 Tax=Fomitiporia mediterranea (strain MF3/22) TaxID=694068 RepID=UPI0004407D49|nr:uncharacterized protein FOMMEDRAFT_154345 [Fomitiporia mediterranea MF3/22]EJD05154.1 hypothetical protein FOMMEDRAFT_154345 [Fomitiporia mediterranea MF3/22]
MGSAIAVLIQIKLRPFASGCKIRVFNALDPTASTCVSMNMKRSEVWEQPATIPQCTSLVVTMGPWQFTVKGEKDEVTGETKPVSIYELVCVVHIEPHKAMEIFDLNMSKLPTPTIALIDEYHEMLRQTNINWKHRTGCFSDVGCRKYQRIDFLPRYSAGGPGEYLTLKFPYPSPTYFSALLC